MKEKYLNGSFSELEYLDAITLTIGRGDLGSGHMSSKISNTLEDSLDVSTDNEDEHSEKCHVCLLPRSENFALLHDDFVHGGFYQTCPNRLLSMKADYPICRGKINCVLKVFQ